MLYEAFIRVIYICLWKILFRRLNFLAHASHPTTYHILDSSKTSTIFLEQPQTRLPFVSSSPFHIFY